MSNGAVHSHIRGVRFWCRRLHWHETFHQACERHRRRIVLTLSDGTETESDSDLRVESMVSRDGFEGQETKRRRPEREGW